MRISQWETVACPTYFGLIYDLTKLEQRETSGYWVTTEKKMLHNHSQAHLNEIEPLKKSALCNLLVALYDDNTSHEAFFLCAVRA